RIRRRQIAECGLRRGEPRNRHPEWRTRNVIKADLVTERHRGRIAAVFAANAELELLPHFAAALGGNADQFADAVAIERYERIARQNAFGRVNAQKACRIVAADAECGLREIVGAKREELRRLGDFVSFQRGARQFDHGADLIFELDAGLGGDLFRRRVDAFFDQIELSLAGDQRHHDFRRYRFAGFAAGLRRRLENGARLHFRDFRVGYRQPTTAKAEHRIELVQLAGTVG